MIFIMSTVLPFTWLMILKILSILFLYFMLPCSVPKVLIDLDVACSHNGNLGVVPIPAALFELVEPYVVAELAHVVDHNIFL